MNISTWLLAHGEWVQYGTFVIGLVGMMGLERLSPARKASASWPARWRANFTLTLVNILALGLLPLSLLAAAQWTEARDLGVLHRYALPTVWVIVLSLLGRGFISWVTHLLMHKVPLLWRVHRVHHTDTELDVSTTVRFHPLEFPIGLLIGLPLVLVMGLSPWVLVAYEILDVAVNLVSHSNISLPGWLERPIRYLLVTPDLHRVHHSTRPQEADSNFSAVFPIWDLVFGTFRARTHEPLQRMPVGLREVRGANTQSLLWLLCVPFRAKFSKVHPPDSGLVPSTDC